MNMHKFFLLQLCCCVACSCYDRTGAVQCRDCTCTCAMCCCNLATAGWKLDVVILTNKLFFNNAAFSTTLDNAMHGYSTCVAWL
jgi:hypothetical protein